MTLHEQPVSPQKPAASEQSEEERSKDKFFAETAALSNAMIAAHGREFAMGTLILAARFIAEGKALTKQTEDTACCGGAHHEGEHHHHNHKT